MAEFWTEGRIDEVARMRAAGMSQSQIGRRYDKSPDAIAGIMRRHPERFDRKPEVQPYQPRAHWVRRETISGAVVTLPRVTLIDGPYQEASAE